ncbi:MAG: lycopene cyclase family protein [Bacteroidota bacterium]
MTSQLTYDYIIIGAGAAGLHLAMQMAQEPFFNDKRVLLLDSDEKRTNDRTWCFWEEGIGSWDTIAKRIWKNGKVSFPGGDVSLDMGSYCYKMVRGIDFYNHARTILEKCPSIEWKLGGVVDVKSGDAMQVHCSDGSNYTACHIFDSRMPSGYLQNATDVPAVSQHFLGWFVETEVDVFDADRFTMMDFRVPYKNTTCFTYVLPFDARRALVEFTLFTPELLEMHEYEKCLREYMEKICGVKNYVISETEYGVIPMTAFDFNKSHSNNHTYIGTAGGWVKASTGYSFKNAQRNAAKIIANIKNDLHPHKEVALERHRAYDLLLLDIFKYRNHLGNGIFEQMYRKNKAESIFRFLDSTSSISEDIRIISSLSPAPFLKSLSRHIPGFIRRLF